MVMAIPGGEVTVGKQSKVQSKLQRALATSSIYRLSREIDAMERVDGFVVGLGAKWVLVARTMDGGYSDGLVALRVRDISSLAKDRSFETAFAMTQPRPGPDDLATIDLDRTDQVIETMSCLSSLIAVERDRTEPGCLWIGRYVGTHGRWVGLLEVRPDASWHRKPLGYRMREVTSVSIGSHYLTALAAVAPEPPRESRQDESR